MAARALRWLVLAALLAFAVLPLRHAAAQEQVPAAPAVEDLPALSDDLEGIERSLTELRARGDLGLERRLQQIMQRSDALGDDAQIRLARLQQQLTALGQAPAAGGPPEPAEIAAERATAQRARMELEAQTRIASYLRVRANQLLETVAARQRAAVLDLVMMETPPPWNPVVWGDAGTELARVLDATRFHARAWLEWYRSQGGLPAMIQAVLAILAGAGVAGMAIRWLASRVAVSGDGNAAAATRAMEALRLAGAPCVAIAAVTLLWSAQGWLAGSFGAVLQRGLIAASLALLAVAMLRASAAGGYGLLQPAAVQPWQLRGAALAILGLVVGVLKEAVLAQPVPPPALLAIMATISGVAAFVILAPMLPSSVWRHSEHGIAVRAMLARTLLAVVAIGPLTAALLGRGVLATYLFNRCLAALVLIWGVAQLRHVVHLALRTALDGPPAAAEPTSAPEEGASDAPARMAGYWAAAAVDILIALLTLRVLLELLDIPRAQIDYWTGLALGDIQVGNAVISLPNILLAILVLAAGLFGSSRLRRWLGKRVLPQSGMEIGLRTSIAAGAGYLGMVLAFLAAIATAGISLSSVAIVAGALSVGMGFGLRTVVENFVAGLLMLIERPIRVGDWVVIGDTEGTVRRISVRATEIETFDSASVVVPNSLFVSSPVTNWTLQNRRGRIRLKLGVGYASDPKEVQAALLECARDNRQVAAYPPPQALFTDFGDSALMFELRCYVRDVDNFPTVRSDLLTAIEKALRERGIHVPFPQQVVHRGEGWEETAKVDLPPPVAIRPAS